MEKTKAALGESRTSSARGSVRVSSVTLLSLFIVDCGSNATEFLRDAYEETSHEHAEG